MCPHAQNKLLVFVSFPYQEGEPKQCFSSAYIFGYECLASFTKVASQSFLYPQVCCCLSIPQLPPSGFVTCATLLPPGRKESLVCYSMTFYGDENQDAPGHNKGFLTNT